MAQAAARATHRIRCRSRRPPGDSFAVGLQRMRVFSYCGCGAGAFPASWQPEGMGIQLRAKLVLETGKQVGMAADAAGFEQRRLHGHIASGLVQAFLHGAHARANLQSRVPAVADELGHLAAHGPALARLSGSSTSTSTSEYGKSCSRPKPPTATSASVGGRAARCQSVHSGPSASRENLRSSAWMPRVEAASPAVEPGCSSGR